MEAFRLTVVRTGTSAVADPGLTDKPGLMAAVQVGYAVGYLRSLGNRGTRYIGDVPLPFLGRISMNLITCDATHVPKNAARVGALVDLIGPHNPVDRIAEQAGTIGYEILTSLGARYHRAYLGGA